MWKKAYPDIDHLLTVQQVMGTETEESNKSGGLHKHLQSIPSLDAFEQSKSTMQFNPEYTYKREETLKHLVKQNKSELEIK